jgi:hypothetical protein
VVLVVTEPTKKSGGLRIPKWVDKVLLLVGFALLAWVVSQYPLEDTIATVASMWPRVLLAPLVALCWFGTSTMAMWLLLDRRVRWLRILWIRLVGDSYNALLPLAGFGGEPFKIHQLSRDVETSLVMATLIRDRVIDNAIGFLFGAAELSIGLTAYAVDDRIAAGLFIYIAACALLGFGGMLLVLTRVPGKIGGWIAKVFGDTPPDKIDTLPLGRTLAVAVCFVGSRVLGLTEKIVFLWILGLPHDFVTAGFVDGFLSAAGYLGFMLPQGLGAFEYATVHVLGYLGATGPQAIAFAVGRRGRMISVGLFGISLHLVALARDAVRRHLRRDDSDRL